MIGDLEKLQEMIANTLEQHADQLASEAISGYNEVKAYEADWTRSFVPMIRNIDLAPFALPTDDATPESSDIGRIVKDLERNLNWIVTDEDLVKIRNALSEYGAELEHALQAKLAEREAEIERLRKDAERIRKATIEECAKVAAELHCNCCWTEDAQIAGDTIARDIRALALDAKEEG